MLFYLWILIITKSKNIGLQGSWVSLGGKSTKGILEILSMIFGNSSEEAWLFFNRSSIVA